MRTAQAHTEPIGLAQVRLGTSAGTPVKDSLYRSPLPHDVTADAAPTPSRSVFRVSRA